MIKTEPGISGSVAEKDLSVFRFSAIVVLLTMRKEHYTLVQAEQTNFARCVNRLNGIADWIRLPRHQLLIH
jgi:hypothetical protein